MSQVIRSLASAWAWTRKRMTSISCRRLHVGGRPDFLPFDNNGSGTVHCSFVRSPPATNQDRLTAEIHFRYTHR